VYIYEYALSTAPDSECRLPATAIDIKINQEKQNRCKSVDDLEHEYKEDEETESIIDSDDDGDRDD